MGEKIIAILGGIGLKLDKLGLDGMTVEQIKTFLTTGKK